MTDQTTFEGTNNKVNTTFWVIGVVALLWNLMGLASFLIYTNMGDDALALMSEAQRAEYESTPMWLMVVYGIATIAGTLGCIALLLRRKLAVLLFLISLIAVVIQFVFGVINSASVKDGGISALILPISVIVVAGLLWYYAKKCEAKGWLS